MTTTRTVTRTARERYEERRQATLRRRKRTLALAGALLVVISSAWIIFFSGFLAVHTIEVTGNHILSEQQILTAASVDRNMPLARLNTTSIADRVQALSPVASASVSRAWPSGVRITVNERQPIAAISQNNEISLIDDDGVSFQRVDAAPTELPLIAIAGPNASSDTRAIIAAYQSLPDEIRGLVQSMSVPDPHSITMHLRDNRTISWGGSDRNSEKARVLAALLGKPGTHYDVSTPTVAVIR